MEVVGLLHVLRRQRGLVVLGLLVAVACAFLSLRPPTKDVALAQGRVMVDTAPSQLAASDPMSADTLGSRATILSDLLASDAARARVAKEAGVAVRDVVITSSSLNAPAVGFPLSRQALEASVPVGAHYTLNATVNPARPVITLDAKGPDRRKVRALVAAAEADLVQLATPAPGRARKFAIESVSDTKIKVVHEGPRKSVALVVAALVFALWCGLVMVIASALRVRRRGTPLAPVIRILVLSVAVSAGVAAVATIAVGGPVSAAATHVLIDTPPPSALHRSVYDLQSLSRRAETLREVASSPPLVADIARRTGLPADQIGAAGHATSGMPQALSEAGSEQRAADIATADHPYRVEVQTRQDAPVIDVSATAPTTAAAVRLADATAQALRAYVETASRRQGVAPERTPRVEQLGAARGSVVSGGKMRLAIGFLAFLLAFAVTAGGLLALRRRATGAPRDRLEPAQLRDAWPHTTRLLPWTFALFLAVLWLVPFDAIQLRAHGPVDLKLDRLILPVVVATWALGRMIGGQLRSPWKPTWIHAAVGFFVIAALLSLIVDAGGLKSTLELDFAIKQIPVLVSYVSLFAICATAIRATEAGAFLKYTLGLATICAIGVLIEYRFHYNVFYDMAGRLLPGSIFQVTRADTGVVDELGRYVVRGPAGHPLEAVAILSMALPIALVSLMQDRTWRGRLLYGFVACLILAATIATARKSAILAPVAVLATMAFFRRRELLRLAPLGLLAIVLIHLFAPGSLGKTTFQLDPNRLNVATVSDRSADYDAVRPDVWTHPIFGRGWGTYDHVVYRVLDSEVLRRLVEMGVVGLLAYLFMIGAVIGGARATISRRDGVYAPAALMGAASAAAFGTVSTLFDVLSFPHAAYTFLYMAGLVAAVAGRVQADVPDHPRRLKVAPPPRRPTVLADPPPRVRAPLPVAHPEPRRRGAVPPRAVPKTGRRRGRPLSARVSSRATALLCVGAFALTLAIQMTLGSGGDAGPRKATRASATTTPTASSTPGGARAAALLAADVPPLRDPRRPKPKPKPKPKHAARPAPTPTSEPLDTYYPTPTPTPNPTPAPTPRYVAPTPQATPRPTATAPPSSDFDTDGGTSSGEFDTNG
jgi:hypothetical protein